jgi:C4-type Zn-finger protein
MAWTTKRLREVFQRPNMKKKANKICPVCGSPNLRLSSKFDIWLTPEQYVCENCGYKGPIVMEIDEEERPERRN